MLATSGVRLYALRHTFATINLENGVSIKTISTDMGHRDPAYTLSLYVGYLPSAVPVSQLYADAFDKMPDSGIIAGAVKGPDEPEPKQRPARFSKRVPEKPRKNPSFYPSRGGKAR